MNDIKFNMRKSIAESNRALRITSIAMRLILNPEDVEKMVIVCPDKESADKYIKDIKREVERLMKLSNQKEE
jgi:hypothetical protein